MRQLLNLSDNTLFQENLNSSFFLQDIPRHPDTCLFEVREALLIGFRAYVRAYIAVFFTSAALRDGSACSLLFFVSVFSSRQSSLLRLGYIFLHMPNHSAVSKPHPTEGAEIYTGCGCGSPRCYEMCCAVCACTSLCAGRCARRLCCWFFFCCLDFSLSNGHVVLEN